MGCGVEPFLFFLLVLFSFFHHAQSGAMLRSCTVQARGALPNSTTGGRSHDVT